MRAGVYTTTSIDLPALQVYTRPTGVRIGPRNTNEVKQIYVWISIGGCSPFTRFLLLAYRRWKERIPIDVLIAKRRSNVAPNLRDNFQVRSNGAPFSIVFFGSLIRKNTVGNSQFYLAVLCVDRPTTLLNLENYFSNYCSSEMKPFLLKLKPGKDLLFIGCVYTSACTTEKTRSLGKANVHR